ncbi:MAG: hypothetical protein QNJ58_28440 [Desulfobacterales bacterium]|nr:hypothetical protein [Desulfobacterales bacterium]
MPVNVLAVRRKILLREKARLNICIAKDLAESFGGRKADYLIRLNRKLRIDISLSGVNIKDSLANAA